MRWSALPAPPRKLGATRIRHGFLFIPRCIENEWRWLERAAWKETWRFHVNIDGEDSSFWDKDEWLDDYYWDDDEPYAYDGSGRELDVW